MKRIILLMLFIFTTIAACATITSRSEEVLSFPFKADSGKSWRYISDRVMGGVSEGEVELHQDGEKVFVRLTGNVSTENRGGFIQLNSSSSFPLRAVSYTHLRAHET